MVSSRSRRQTGSMASSRMRMARRRLCHRSTRTPDTCRTCSRRRRRSPTPSRTPQLQYAQFAVNNASPTSSVGAAASSHAPYQQPAQYVQPQLPPQSVTPALLQYQPVPMSQQMPPPPHPPPAQRAPAATSSPAPTASPRSASRDRGSVRKVEQSAAEHGCVCRVCRVCRSTCREAVRDAPFALCSLILGRGLLHQCAQRRPAGGPEQ